MPNGYPYLLGYSKDYCTRCGDPLCDHDRERVTHENGTYSYDYYCPSGRPFQRPAARGGA